LVFAPLGGGLVDRAEARCAGDQLDADGDGGVLDCRQAGAARNAMASGTNGENAPAARGIRRAEGVQFVAVWRFGEGVRRNSKGKGQTLGVLPRWGAAVLRPYLFRGEL